LLRRPPASTSAPARRSSGRANLCHLPAPSTPFLACSVQFNGAVIPGVRSIEATGGRRGRRGVGRRRSRPSEGVS
jgi:hypothetical protein